MTDSKTGSEVVAQAHDESLGNTEPLALKGVIGAIISAGLMYLVFSGKITEDESNQITDAIDTVVKAIIAVAPLIVALLGRNDVYSPHAAAEIAVINAEQPAGSAPTLQPPP